MTTTETNRAYFDGLAEESDGQLSSGMEEVMRRIRKELDFIGVAWDEGEDSESDDGSVSGTDSDSGDLTRKSTSVQHNRNHPQRQLVRLLDYACGTGLMSHALAPYVTTTTAIDLSPKMTTLYNQSALNQGLPPQTMSAHPGNLLCPDPPPLFSTPPFTNFDLLTLCLALHHFDEPPDAIGRLAGRLRSGGVFVVVDFLEHGALPGDTRGHETVGHWGFEAREVKRMFVEAGVGGGFRIKVLGKTVRVTGHGAGDEGMARRLFIARGEKKAQADVYL